MNKDEISAHLTSYYESIALSPEQLQKLKATSKDTGQSSSSKPLLSEGLSGRWIPAAAAVILFLSFATWQFLPSSSISPEALAQLVSKEIALNHNKGLSPEFETDEYALLVTQLDKLDFTLANSEKVRSLGLTLKGARYCSIHGQLAAQIRLETDDGELYTLYQTHINEELIGLPEEAYPVDGVLVEHWNEDGVFFGLAKTIQ